MSNGLAASGSNLETPKQAPPVAERGDEAPDQLSSVEADERARETLAEAKDEILHAESKTELEAAKEVIPPKPQAAGAAPQAPAPKDEAIIEVEKILEEGIGPFYASLPAEAKPLFKKRGEEAATEIAEMVRTVKVRVKRVLELIYIWLKTIPGVNKFFLEQEAKIKTDRIVELVEARKEETK